MAEIDTINEKRESVHEDIRTVEVLLPNPSYFIINYHGALISINGFTKIHIQFADRVFVRDGDVQKNECPMITYYILLGPNAQDVLYAQYSSFARESSNSRCIVRHPCRILLGVLKYEFRAFVNFIPNSICRTNVGTYISMNNNKEDAFIEMDFNRVKSSIYNSNIKEFYVEYDKAYTSRYELLDI